MRGDRSDSERYFEAVYGTDELPGLIGLVTFKPSRCECVSTGAEAALRVSGALDIYSRISLLREAPPKGKRGDASLTAAIPGVWADFDVNGSPNGRESTVTDAFASVDAAIEFAGCVLEPTVLVRSGHGVHAYWLLPEPWRLEDDEQREQAEALVEDWQATLRGRAAELGVSKLDSTYDLARVFRPPGSLNAKGDKPAPVELLLHDGPRCSIEQIRGACAVPRAKAKSRDDRPKVDESVGEEWVEQFPAIAKIARRKGKTPGDGSPSAWDYYLGCTAAEMGATDDELDSLLRYARSLHPDDKHKDKRDDYIERTIANVREKVGSEEERDSDAARLARLTKVSRAEKVGLRVTGAIVVGHGAQAYAELFFTGERGDYTVHFERFDHVAMPTKLGDQLATTIGVALPDLSRQQARRFAADMRELSPRELERTENELIADAAREMLAEITSIRDFDFDSQADRARVWRELRDARPEDAAERQEDLPRMMIAGRVRSTGELVLRTTWVHRYLRGCSSNWTPARAHAALQRNGWVYPNTQGRVKCTPPNGVPFALVVYFVPAGWATR